MAPTVKNLPEMQETQETWDRSLGLGRSPAEGNGYLLQYSCLENPMDRGTYRAMASPWGHKELDTPERLALRKY